MVEVTLQFDKAGTVKNRVPRRSYWGCSARDSIRRRSHDGRSWRHDANGQALTELTDGSNRPSLLATECSS